MSENNSQFPIPPSNNSFLHLLGFLPSILPLCFPSSPQTHHACFTRSLSLAIAPPSFPHFVLTPPPSFCFTTYCFTLTISWQLFMATILVIYKIDNNANRLIQRSKEVQIIVFCYRFIWCRPPADYWLLKYFNFRESIFAFFLVKKANLPEKKHILTIQVDIDPKHYTG